jgi:hypothetical protein
VKASLARMATDIALDPDTDDEPFGVRVVEITS